VGIKHTENEEVVPAEPADFLSNPTPVQLTERKLQPKILNRKRPAGDRTRDEITRDVLTAEEKGAKLKVEYYEMKREMLQEKVDCEITDMKKRKMALEIEIMEEDRAYTNKMRGLQAKKLKLEVVKLELEVQQLTQINNNIVF
jgi:hypothetical protein